MKINQPTELLKLAKRIDSKSAQRKRSDREQGNKLLRMRSKQHPASANFRTRAEHREDRKWIDPASEIVRDKAEVIDFSERIRIIALAREAKNKTNAIRAMDYQRTIRVLRGKLQIEMRKHREAKSRDDEAAMIICAREMAWLDSELLRVRKLRD